jgi:RNA 2',3'-cyclic 3'-phosphodiesterase
MAVLCEFAESVSPVSHQLLEIAMESIRTFIAVPLPTDIRRRLAEVTTRLMQSGADVKWVPEGNFHITLKFLGNVERTRVSAVCGAVEKAVDGVRAFDLYLSGVGAFPKPSRPSVVWVGITSGGDELKALAKCAEEALEDIGFPREAREFSAHITLGRVKYPGGDGTLREAIENLRNETVGRVHVDTVVVMKSELRRTGPVYTPIADFGLRVAPGF